MKITICILIAFLLLALLGCTAAQSPDRPAAPGVSSPTESSTAPTEEATPLSNFLPEPFGGWSEKPATDSIVYSAIWENVSLSDALEYIQRLKDHGYSKDTLEIVEETECRFYGRNPQNVGLCLQFDCSGSMHLTLCADLRENSVPPSEALKAAEAWTEHPSRAQVPEPPTQYWEGIHTVEQPSEIPFYNVQLYGMSYQDVRDYARQLAAAGFDADPWESHSYLGNFCYSARNAEGWWVQLDRVFNLDAESYTVFLRISNYERRTTDWTSDYTSALYYLPDPEQNWSVLAWLSCCQVLFPDMTYQEAVDYVQAFRQQLTQPNYRIISQEQLIQNDDAQTLEYRVSYMYIYQAPSAFRFTLRLIYDASNVDAPCSLYISK